MCDTIKYKIINHSRRSIPEELFEVLVDMADSGSMRLDRANTIAEEYNLRINEFEIDFTGPVKKLIFTIEDT